MKVIVRRKIQLSRDKLIILMLIVSIGLLLFFFKLYLSRTSIMETLLPSTSAQPKAIFALTGTSTHPLNSPLGVGVGDNRRIFVADSGNNRVLVYDANGKLEKQIGTAGSGEGQLFYPTSVVVRDKQVFVADFYNNRISIFDTEGKFLKTLPDKDDQQRHGQIKPLALALDDDDNLYVSDINNQLIVVFDNEGRITRKFGGPGNQQGQLAYANALAVNSEDEEIYVADSNNARIQVFDLEGNFKKVLKEIQAIAPRGIAWDQDTETLMVVDTLGHKVIGAVDGKPAFALGQLDSQLGRLSFPNGVSVDEEGRVYITDRENKRVVVFEY